MQQIRKLNESEMHDIYTRLFPEAFPKDEIRSVAQYPAPAAGGQIRGLGPV